MGSSRRFLSALAAGLVVLGAAGCSGPSLEDSLNPELGKSDCKPASPAAGPERHFAIIGTPLTKSASAQGLFFKGDAATNGEAKPGERKFVVRVTGEGKLGAEVTAPGGKPAQLSADPEPRDRDDLAGPGDEWQMNLALDEPGCWALTLTRDAEPTAAFWFDVQ
ncbi:hypothetical protein ACXR2T_12085 [Leucobacter sp. HY1910]